MLDQRVEQILAAYRLKTLPRAGWIQSGVEGKQVESVASHSWGMAFLFTTLEPELPEELDRYRALRMAVLHDLAESQVGDFTPKDGVSTELKHEKERSAYASLVAEFDHSDELLALWLEFEAGETLEARTIKALDKLDMLLQASLYESSAKIDLHTFWENMDGLFKEPVIKTIYEHIRMNRSKFKGSVE